jgi:hypothetical protein
MAIPSGSGTEILKVGMFTAVDTTEHKLIDGVANHIYTVLSVTVCETAGAAEVFNLYIADDGGATDYEILSDQALAANKTFIFNDRIVISGTDELICVLTGTGDVDIVCSYIDQDWS